jgi:Helix-turn-helix domain
MPTSYTDGLKVRWSKELRANPPTLPIWQKSHGTMALVALTLYLYASADGSNIFPSAKKVGEIVGIHRNTVGKYRKALVELGMVALVRKGKGTRDPSEYRLCEPSQWRHTVEAGFDAAMASTPKPVPKPVAEDVSARVRTALQGATNRKALVELRAEWAYVIEQDAVLNALFCTLAGEFKLRETW